MSNFEDYKNNKILQTLGKLIKALRKQRRWKLSTLSYYAGISPSTLSRIESGESDPKYSTINKIADAFELSLEDFIKKLNIEEL